MVVSTKKPAKRVFFQDQPLQSVLKKGMLYSHWGVKRALKMSWVFQLPIMFTGSWSGKGVMTSWKQCQWIGGHFQAYRLVAIGGNSCGVNPLGCFLFYIGVGLRCCHNNSRMVQWLGFVLGGAWWSFSLRFGSRSFPMLLIEVSSPYKDPSLPTPINAGVR